MSTRAQIQVKGSEVMIYRHSDGYPSGVLPTLVPRMKGFIKARGTNDVEYDTANVMKAFVEASIDSVADRIDSGMLDPEMYHDMFRYTGYGIGTQMHGDIEYFYEIDLKEKKIIVYAMSWEGDQEVDEIVDLSTEEE